MRTSIGCVICLLALFAISESNPVNVTVHVVYLDNGNERELESSKVIFINPNSDKQECKTGDPATLERNISYQIKIVPGIDGCTFYGDDLLYRYIAEWSVPPDINRSGEVKFIYPANWVTISINDQNGNAIPSASFMIADVSSPTGKYKGSPTAFWAIPDPTPNDASDNELYDGTVFLLPQTRSDDSNIVIKGSKSDTGLKILIMPAIGGQLMHYYRLNRSQYLDITSLTRSFQFEWFMADIQINIQDQTGNDIKDAGFDISGTYQSLLSGTPISLPITDESETGYETMEGYWTTGLRFVIRPAINGVMARVNDLARTEYREISNDLQYITFNWLYKNVEIAILKNYGTPMTGAKFNFCDSYESGSDYENVSWIKLPINDAAIYPELVSKAFICGIPISIAPGPNNSCQAADNGGRFLINVGLCPNLIIADCNYNTAGIAPVGQNTREVEIDIVDQFGCPITGAKFNLWENPLPQDLNNGARISLPISISDAYPNSISPACPRGTAIKVMPAIAGTCLGDNLYAKYYVKVRPDIDKYRVVWYYVNGSLQIIDNATKKLEPSTHYISFDLPGNQRKYNNENNKISVPLNSKKDEIDDIYYEELGGAWASDQPTQGMVIELGNDISHHSAGIAFWPNGYVSIPNSGERFIACTDPSTNEQVLHEETLRILQQNDAGCRIDCPEIAEDYPPDSTRCPEIHCYEKRDTSDNLEVSDWNNNFRSVKFSVSNVNKINKICLINFDRCVDPESFREKARNLADITQQLPPIKGGCEQIDCGPIGLKPPYRDAKVQWQIEYTSDLFESIQLRFYGLPGNYQDIIKINGNGSMLKEGILEIKPGRIELFDIPMSFEGQYPEARVTQCLLITDFDKYMGNLTEPASISARKMPVVVLRLVVNQVINGQVINNYQIDYRLVTESIPKRLSK